MRAGGGLRYLIEEGMRILQHDRTKRSVTLHFARKRLCTDPERRSRDLYVNASWGRFVTEHDRQSHHPFIANGADLRGPAVRQRVDKRSDTALDEVDKIDNFVRLI